MTVNKNRHCNWEYMSRVVSNEEDFILYFCDLVTVKLNFNFRLSSLIKPVDFQYFQNSDLYLALERGQKQNKSKVFTNVLCSSNFKFWNIYFLSLRRSERVFLHRKTPNLVAIVTKLYFKYKFYVNNVYFLSWKI